MLHETCLQLGVCRGPGTPCSARSSLQRHMPPRHRTAPGIALLACLPACPSTIQRRVEAQLALAGVSLSVYTCLLMQLQLSRPNKSTCRMCVCDLGLACRRSADGVVVDAAWLAVVWSRALTHPSPSVPLLPLPLQTSGCFKAVSPELCKSLVLQSTATYSTMH